MSDVSPRIVRELRNGFLTGVAVVPLLITLMVLTIAFNYINVYLDLLSDSIIPFSTSISVPPYGVVEREVLVEITTPVILLSLILFVELTVNSSRYGQRAVDYFDHVIEGIPAVGSVYESFRQMSDAMLDSDTGNFQDVVLVEFPTERSYTVGFVTSDAPRSITGAVDESDMRTVFMPLAPNPMMGGHVLFVQEDRIVDVDLTVEEGIRALVTSGVALTDATGDVDGVSERKLRAISMNEQAEQRFDPGRQVEDSTRWEDVLTDRPGEYDENVDPERAQTPDALARRERGEPSDSERSTPSDKDDACNGATPAERAGRAESEREPTETPPSEAADRNPEDRVTTDTNPERAAGRDPDEREPTDEPPEQYGVRGTETREGATRISDERNRDEAATVEGETPDEASNADDTREKDVYPDQPENVNEGVTE